ncbi:MAG: MBL fold metallo-hydrolase [Blastomonas sp.]
MAKAKSRRWLAGLAITIAAVAMACWVAREQVGEMLFTRAVEQNFGTDHFADLPDGLHVILCGAGSPLPDPQRSGPCTIVVAGKKQFLIDAGSGAARQFGLMGLPIGELDGIFLTHFHSDHIDGLGEAMLLRWASVGNRTPIPVYGGEGVQQVVDGFNQAYRLDTGYRVAHHGADVVPPQGRGGAAKPFNIPDGEDSLVIIDQGDLKVTAVRVPHDPVTPAVGYRFDYKGRSVVISGDTSPAPALAGACNGCDLVVHEALNPDMVAILQKAAARRGNKTAAKIMSDIPPYHTSPADAARIAQKGKAKMLVLTHIIPPLPSRLLYPYYLKGTSGLFDGDIIIGEDGMLFSLLPGKTGIERERIG